jgi:hypothetical protein
MPRPDPSSFLAEVLKELEDLPAQLAPRLEELLGSDDEAARKAALVELFEELTRE